MMFGANFLGALSLASFALARPAFDHEPLGAYEDLQMRQTTNPLCVLKEPPNPPTRSLTVDLYIHVVAKSDRSRADGWIDDATLNQQVDIMQRAYNKHGIRFNYKGRTMNVRPEWTERPADKEAEIKGTLRQGDYRTLNMFIIQGWGPGSLGRCPNPETVANHANKTVLDGPIIQPATLPGGNLEHESEGLTAVHEVGHWFGLYHPWEPHGNGMGNGGLGNGCYGEGDKVDDTPAQQFDITRASCLNAAKDGLKVSNTCKKVCKVDNWDDCIDDPCDDPLDNYMGYCPDRFLKRFTEGQVDRMYMIYDKYRRNA